LNGEYELTLVHPIDEAGKWQRLVEGCILRAPVPAAMTPRVNFTAPGDDNRTEVWRVNTDFSGAETRKGTLRLRSGPGTKYKVLATYKNGSFVQVIPGPFGIPARAGMRKPSLSDRSAPARPPFPETMTSSMRS